MYVFICIINISIKFSSVSDKTEKISTLKEKKNWKKVIEKKNKYYAESFKRNHNQTRKKTKET